MSDTGNGYFEPGSKLTVEQAVVIVYRSYKQIPKLVKSDSDGIETNVEQTVKSFECGLTETYDGSSYYIKENGSELMRFESDVYSRIFCDEYSGKRLAFAVNFNDKTDVYDLGTKELLYTIPYITYRTDAENGWVYVYSSRFMPAYSGLYSMDGKELIAPEYSEKELNTISKNDFDLPQEEYRAPDGWIYYSNWNDNGSLNKVDTNGENGKCLVQGLDCYDTEYFKGTLFFKARENDALYCIDKDGEDFTKISDNAELFWPRVYSFRSDVSGDIDIRTDVNGNKVLTGFTCYYYEKKEESFGGKLFYGEPVECSREYALENGISLLEDEEAYILYEFSADNGEADAKKVADFPAYNITSDLENDKMYFMNADELVRSGGSPIYIYDGKDITAVSDGVKAVEFGFWYDPKTSEPDMSRLCYITQDEIEAGTYHVLDPDTGETTVENFTKYVYEPKKIQIYGDISTDDLEVWRDLDTLTLYIEYNGSQKDLGQSTPVFREGNWIYYWNTMNISYGWSSSMPIRVIGNQMHEVRAYNYVTDEDVLAADDYDLFWQSADNLCIYATPMLQYRVFENSKTVSVYPCKGISKYGEARCFDKFIDVVWQPDYLYKIDTDGNITAVTDCDTEYWLYVPEGEDKPEMQQWG